MANFPANTGYAWNFIEGLYAGVADRLAARGVDTWVAYPEVPRNPDTLRGSAARAVELPIRFGDAGSLRELLAFVRSRRVRTLYLTDRAAWHPAFAALRWAGVRRIVVHDHSSGRRTVPRGPKRVAKWLSRRVPGTVADEVVGVSDFVADRAVRVGLIPPDRVRRIWNSISLPDPDVGRRPRLREVLNLDTDRPVVACACRATPEKGVQHLLRAFDRAAPRFPAKDRPVLAYMGDGPYMGTLRAIGDELDARDDIVFTGYRPNAAELLAGADVAVTPSIWHEAFGLAVLEPMAHGVAVIASRIGGIPEVVVDGETGLLVPPGDEAALADALVRLLESRDERARLGRRGRRHAAERFSREHQLDELYGVLSQGFQHNGSGPGE